MFFIYNFWHIRNFENLKTACERTQKTESNWFFKISIIYFFDGKKWKKLIFPTFLDSFSTITWKFCKIFENMNVPDERTQKTLSNEFFIIFQKYFFFCEKNHFILKKLHFYLFWASFSSITFEVLIIYIFWLFQM